MIPSKKRLTGNIEEDANKIAWYITRHQLEYKNVETARKYYKGENTAIAGREMQYINADGKLETDIYKSNVKTSLNDFRKIVKQLVGYLLGKAPSLETDVFDDFTEDELHLLLRDMLIKSQVDKVAWARPYINSIDELQFAIYGSDSIIPVYDDTVEDLLMGVIYFYSVTEEDDKQTLYAEYWTDKLVYKYIRPNGQDNYRTMTAEDDAKLVVNPHAHMKNDVKFANGDVKVQEGESFGMIPFIPLQYDSDGLGMLDIIGKDKIDALDFLLADGVNNFLDMADVITIVKNFAGDNMSELLENIKVKKVIGVGDGGGVETTTNEIPMEARKEMIGILKNAIYTDGDGVDIDSLTAGGGTITNVFIKAMFTNLDLKADFIAPTITKFINKVGYCIAQNEGKAFEKIKVTYNKSMIANEVELLNANKDQVGKVSELTRLSNNPYVTNPEEEEKALALESGGYDDFSEEGDE